MKSMRALVMMILAFCCMSAVAKNPKRQRPTLSVGTITRSGVIPPPSHSCVSTELHSARPQQQPRNALEVLDGRSAALRRSDWEVHDQFNLYALPVAVVMTVRPLLVPTDPRVTHGLLTHGSTLLSAPGGRLV